MSTQPGREKTARDDLERITIFRHLADEYVELVNAVGEVYETVQSSDQSVQNRTALSLRLMLERKFVTSDDKNTFIPKVINALKRAVPDDHQATKSLDRYHTNFKKTVSGESTGISASFNNVELDFEQVRMAFAYGRLMHSDRDKFVTSDVLSQYYFNLLVRQSKLLATNIIELRDFIVKAIEDGAIPLVSKSLKETWHEVHTHPELFEVGARLNSDEIPALRDDGSQPLPGGSRVRTVAFHVPEIGRFQPEPEGDG